MSIIAHRRAGGAVAAVALGLLVAGCGGGGSGPAAVAPASATATQQPTTSTPTPSPTPTKTGPGPMTAAELAWLAAVQKMHAGIDATARRNTNLTRTAMLSLSRSLGDCRRLLRRIGQGTARLRPVATLVNKACAQFDKGAKCWATAARVSDISGAVEAGTPAERTQSQAISCGTAAYGDGSNTLIEAEAKAEEIKLAAG
jgi:hypothetical protein